MIVNSHMSYPEVISYEKLQDGTLKLTIEAVWEIRMLDQAITSELMIKPMEDGSFQYLSNKVIKFRSKCKCRVVYAKVNRRRVGRELQ